jgi:hypothetical protein
MGPHPKHFHDAFLFENLVNDTMLDVDSPGKGAGEIADEFFEWGRVLMRVAAKNGQNRPPWLAIRRVTVFWRLLRPGG